MKTGYKARDTLERFFIAYLVERDLEKTLAFVADDIYSVGTGKCEMATNKEEFKGLLQAEFKEAPQSIDFTMSEYKEKEVHPKVISSVCKVIARTYDKNKVLITFSTRLTTVLREEADGYKACCFHMSSPNGLQEEDEFFPLKYGINIHEKIQISSQKKIIELMSDIIPGGIMGAYLEPGFPLYVINEELLKCLGYTYEELMEETKGLMTYTMHEEDVAMVEKTIWESFAVSDEYEVQYRMKKKDGTFIWVFDKGKRIVSEDGRPAIISIIMDISKSVEVQERLRKEAAQDPLLHIYNRKEAIRLIEQECCNGTLLLMDIDNFKKVNDYYGHQAGDQVLKEWARILTEHVRDEDIVARLGGDEFIVYLSGITDKEVVCRRAGLFCKLFVSEIINYPMAGPSISIGIVCRTGCESFAELYECADKVLYEVKNTGKGYAKVVVSSKNN